MQSRSDEAEARTEALILSLSTKCCPRCCNCQAPVFTSLCSFSSPSTIQRPTPSRTSLSHLPHLLSALSPPNSNSSSSLTGSLTTLPCL